jgi:hypothetical protein
VVNGLGGFDSSLVQPTLQAVKQRDEVVRSFTSIRFGGGRLYPQGFAFTKGCPAPSYGSISTKLRLRRDNQVWDFPLGGIIVPSLSTKHFENEFCDYSHGGFASPRHEGVDLDALPVGKYAVSLVVTQQGRGLTKPGRSDSPINVWGNTGDSLLNFRSDHQGSQLVKRDAIGPFPVGSYFTLDNKWVDGSLLHVEGIFAIAGIPAATYEDSGYYLVLMPLDAALPQRTLKIATGNQPGIGELVGDVWQDYSKACFATPGYRGIDLSDLQPGSYDMHVTARFGSSVFSRPLGEVLIMDKGLKFGDQVEAVSA